MPQLPQAAGHVDKGTEGAAQDLSTQRPASLLPPTRGMGPLGPAGLLISSSPEAGVPSTFQTPCQPLAPTGGAVSCLNCPGPAQGSGATGHRPRLELPAAPKSSSQPEPPPEKPGWKCKPGVREQVCACACEHTCVHTHAHVGECMCVRVPVTHTCVSTACGCGCERAYAHMAQTH